MGADDARGPAGVDPADLCPCDALWHLQTGYAGAAALGSGLRLEPVYGGGHEAVCATLPLVTASFSLGQPARIGFAAHVAPHLVEFGAEPPTYLQFIRTPYLHLDLLGMEVQQHLFNDYYSCKRC